MKKNKNKNKNWDNNEFIKNAHEEERKFSYINPVINEDLNSKYIFWNYSSEKAGRILILLGRLISFMLAVIYIVLVKNNAISGELGSSAKSIFNKYGNYIIIGTIILEIGISFLYVLPMILVRKSNTLHSWGMTYIYLGIIFFLFWEILFVVTSAFDGFTGSDSKGLESLNASYIILMIVILVTSIIFITGGSLLISKSDDIRRQSTSE